MSRDKWMKDGRPRLARGRRIVSVTLCALGLWPIAGRADDRNWIGGNSTWDNPQGWHPLGLPANTESATVAQSGATLTYHNPDGNAITLGTLAVDSGGTLSQSKD